METFALPEASAKDRELQEKVLKEFELRRKIRQTVVPTDDGKVRQLLRQLGEPITLFGEREMERRERLKKILAQREGEVEIDLPTLAGQTVVEETQVQRELFYTEGTADLKSARLQIAAFSLSCAKSRIAGAKRRAEDMDLRQDFVDKHHDALGQVSRMTLHSSELGDDRPISHCQFSPDGKLLAACGWGGALGMWNTQSCSKKWSVRLQDDRCTGLAWHPQATLSQSELAANIAVGSADCSAHVLNAEGGVLCKLEGHTDRLARVAFHPMGRHLATASYDMTWRLWDVESGSCLLEQEGHSRAVYTVAFHPDGALAASGGLDAYGRVWDCRTGRSVFVLDGHVRHVLALDFSPNGYHIVTGSDDHTCKVWDLRKRKCLYTMLAHRSLVSNVRYERNYGQYILTAGYDNLAKVWSARDFKLIKTLAGHEGKIMGADINPDGSHAIATTAYDRTIKMWRPDDLLVPPPLTSDGGAAAGNSGPAEADGDIDMTA